MVIETLDRPVQKTKIENLPNGHSPLAQLGNEYLTGVLEGHTGALSEINPLELITTDAVQLFEPIDASIGDDLWGPTEKERIELSIDAQLKYVGKVRELLDEQATFDLLPMDLSNDGGNIMWLGALTDGHWPIAVGGSMEGHDRSNHNDALVYSSPEQAVLVIEGASQALRARKDGDDIIIPPEYAASKRGETEADNFLGHLDKITEGLGDLSPQTVELLAPLLNEAVGFSEAIKLHITSLVEKVEIFLEGDKVSKNGIGPALALALMSLETITLGAQNRDVSPTEIRVALYNVIKGYIKTAAILRGEEIPKTLLDFWPIDVQGNPQKMTNEELLTTLS